MPVMISQDDIARKLGISRGSVNQVLNDSPHCRVSTGLREKILATASLMGYPTRSRRASNPVAQAIAYVLCKPKLRDKIFPDEWHLSLLCHLQRTAQADQHDILFFAADDHPRTQHAVALKIARLRPLGVILDGEVHRSMVYEFMKLDIPFLLSGMLEFSHEPQWVNRISTVAMDVQQSVDLLVGRLFDRGASRIGIIIDPSLLYSNKVLLSAYRRSLQSRGIAINPSWLQVYQGYPDANLLERYRIQGVSIDGLICTSDLMQSLGQYARENRLPLPGERIALCATRRECRHLGIEGLICYDDQMPRIAQTTYGHLKHIITHPHACSHLQIPGKLYDEPDSED